MPLREPDEAARLAEGWERRFVVEGGRVAEYVLLYESLGFEVVTVPVSPEDAIAECTDCRVVALLQFRLIYTRARRAAGTPCGPEVPKGSAGPRDGATS